MCAKAKARLYEWIEKKPNTLPKIYGANYYSIKFNDNSVLDSGMIVQSWYKYENDYNYSEKLLSPNLTGKFVVHDVRNNVFRVISKLSHQI